MFQLKMKSSENNTFIIPSKGLAVSYLWWSKNDAKQSKHSLPTALLQIVIKGGNAWQTRDVWPLVHIPSNTYIYFIIHIFKRLMINLLISWRETDTSSGKNALLKFLHSRFLKSQEENPILLRCSPVTYPLDHATSQNTVVFRKSCMKQFFIIKNKPNVTANISYVRGFIWGSKLTFLNYIFPCGYYSEALKSKTTAHKNTPRGTRYFINSLKV